MRYLRYLFNPRQITDSWRACVYFDVETAEDFEWLREGLTKEERLQYLNIDNAKLMVVGLFSEYAVSLPAEDSRQVEDMVLYLFRGNRASLGRALLEILDKTKLPAIVAHNGNNFDFLLLKGLVSLRDFKNNLYFTYKDRRIACVDTKKIGEACGVASLDGLARLFGLQGKEYSGDFVDYAYRDVELLMRLGKKFEEYGLAWTPQRQARKVLSEVLKKPVLTETEKPPPQMVGGRVQLWEYEVKGPVYVYDFNSLYPSMLAYMHHADLLELDEVYYISAKSCGEEDFRQEEVKLRYFTELILRRRLFDAREYLKRFYPLDYLYFMRVRIKGLRAEYKGLEPVFMEYFPFTAILHGRRVYSWHPSLEYDVHGYEVLFLPFFEYSIQSCVKVYAGKLPFRRVLRDMYEERKRLKRQGDSREALLKLTLNSIFGILGQKAKGRESELIISAVDALEVLRDLSERRYVYIYELSKNPIACVAFDTNENCFLTLTQISLSDVLVRAEWKGDYLPNSCPYIALGVTSSARFWLYLHILWLAMKGFRVYYGDTDSIHTNAPPEVLKPFLSDNMLDLKHEYTAIEGFYLAPKTYTLITLEGKKVSRHKGLGETLEKTFVVQTIRTPFTILTRTFISPDARPSYIPRGGKPVLNLEGLKTKEVPEYMELIARYEKFVKDYQEEPDLQANTLSE